jgi:hypothetical protein
MIRIPENSSPNVKNRSFRITADVDVPQDGAEGILATQGGRFAGWAFLVLNGKPEFVYAYSNQDGARYPHQRNDKTRIIGSERLAPGAHTIVFDFAYDGGGIGKGGTGTITVDGKKAAAGRIAQTTPIPKFSLDESFDVGQDTGTPVIDDYDAQMPFKFTGILKKLQIHISPVRLSAAEMDEVQRRAAKFAQAAQ